MKQIIRDVTRDHIIKKIWMELLSAIVFIALATGSRAADIDSLNPPQRAEYKLDVDWYDNLRMWLREHSTHGQQAWAYPLYPPEMIRRLRNGGSATCGAFSVAYAGLVKHYGIPVRLVHVYKSSADGVLNSHTFNEVWSFDLDKWVTEDADYNLSWRDTRGIPLSAQEAQASMYSGGIHSGHKLAPYFYRLIISTQTEYLGCSYLECQRGRMTHMPRDGERDDPAWLNYKDNLQID